MDGGVDPVAGDTRRDDPGACNFPTDAGDNRILPCGFFILDSFSFPAGRLPGAFPPCHAGWTAVSGHRADKDLGKSDRKGIGKEIASRAGIALAWDVEGDPFTSSSPLSSRNRPIVIFT